MGGIVSSVGSIFKSPKKPKTYSATKGLDDQVKSAQASAKYGTYGVNSSLGNINIAEDVETGLISKEFEDSKADTIRNQLIGQGLAGLSLDPQRAEQAYYDNATRLLTPQFEQQQSTLDENLINRGIGLGSEQYDRLQENLRNTQQGTLSDIANQSVFQGQNLLGSQIGNIGSLAGQRDINSLAGLGSNVSPVVQSTYADSINSANQASQAQAAQNSGNLGNLAQAGALGYLAFSDRRLKENLVKVGKLENGLDVYIGNYNDKAIELDSSLNKKPQLFLIAQEVKEVIPSAVVKVGDYYKVDYKGAVKNG